MLRGLRHIVFKVNKQGNKKMKMKKLQLVKNPEITNQDSPIAFQLVEFTIDFYGNKQVDTLDTRIMPNGEQFVIDGNGWIKSGTNLNAFA